MGGHVDAQGDLSALSGAELRKLLAETDERCKSIRQKLHSVKHKAREQSLKGGKKYWDSLPEAERKRVRQAFETFDADKSGRIDLKELRALSTELGHDISEKDAAAAMKQLDKDGDGTVDFDEFVQWWGEDLAGKGGKLWMVRKLLKGKLDRDELVQKAAELPQSTDPAKLLSYTSALTVGTVTADWKPGTSVSAEVTPSNSVDFEAEARKLLPDDFPFTVWSPDEEVHVDMRAVLAVDLMLRKGATEAQVDRAIAHAKQWTQEFKPGPDGDKHFRMEVRKTRTADGALGATVHIFLRSTPDEDPLMCGLQKLSNLSGNPVDSIPAQIFSIGKATAQLGACLGDELRIDNHAPAVSLLDRGARVAYTARLSAFVADLVDRVVLDAIAEEPDEDIPKKILACFAPRLFESFDARASVGTPGEAIRSVAQGLASMPVKYAQAQGKMTEEIAAESQRLAKHIEQRLSQRVLKCGAPVSACISLPLLLKLLDEDEPELLDRVKTVTRVVEGISAIRAYHAAANVQLSFQGMHLLRNIDLDDPQLEKRALAAKKHFMMFNGDSDEDSSEEESDGEEDDELKERRAQKEGSEGYPRILELIEDIDDHWARGLSTHLSS